MLQHTPATLTKPAGSIALTAFSALAVVASVSTEASAAPMICETWRDYYFNADTYEFIEWIGEPYEICYPADEPMSRPSDPIGDYDGGWGNGRDPRKPTCNQCAQKQMACQNTANTGLKKCQTYHRSWARDWCRTQRRDIDHRMIDNYQCEKLEGPAGKPVMTCHGPGIDRCVESFEFGSKTRTTQEDDAFSINIKDVFGVSGGATTTVSWGGRRGFADACQSGHEAAFVACHASADTCKEDAGDCKK